MAIGETYNKIPVIAWVLGLLVRLHPITGIEFLADISDPRFHFPQLFFGPSLEYSSYMSFIDKSIYKITKTHGNASLTKSGRKIPTGRKRAACRKMALGLAYFGLFVQLTSRGYDYSEALKPRFMMRSAVYR
jgi:lysophospholipid acyltransferase